MDHNLNNSFVISIRFDGICFETEANRIKFETLNFEHNVSVSFCKINVVNKVKNIF